MKRIKIFLLIITILFGINISNIVVKAQETNNYQDVEFIGKIIPVRKFYIGEYAQYHDFEIDGEFIDDKGNSIPSSEWKIFAIESVKKNTVNICIKHLPSFDDTNEVFYNDIEYKVDIQTKDFNEKLNVNFKKNIKAYNIEDAISKLKFYNSLGNRVQGTVEYNVISKDSDNVLIKYVFKPYDLYLETDYGYEEYSIYKGSLNIKLVPQN